MPFVNRRVEPLYLSNKTLPNGCSTELENVANNTLANLVRQLAVIADHANSIFDGICIESRDIYTRSSRLKDRAQRLEEYLETLDARAVVVPVSTLSDFKTLTDHYRYRPQVQENLITPASRPQCIEIQYHKASTDLKDIFEKLKEYHEDEVTVCNLCQSISLSRLNCDTDSSEYGIEFPRSANGNSNEQRRRKPLLPNSKLPARPRSEGDLLDDYIPPNRGTLPTPEEVMRRNVSQSTVINVDTSGSGFERMQTFRRSLTVVGRKLEKAKKKRWRRTVSGIPDEIQVELQTESAEEGDRLSTDQENNVQTLKTMSLDRRTFSQIKPIESPADIAVVTPIRRRRRPRSLRLPGPIIFPGFLHWRENHSKQDKKIVKSGARNRHSVALPVQNTVPTPSPSQGYSSCSDDKALLGSPRRRPHSLALPPSSIPQSHAQLIPLSHAPLIPLSPAQPTGKQLYVTSNRTVPNAIIPTSSVTVSIKTRQTPNGSGDAQDQLPLNELLKNIPKVRLRNTRSKATKEERQSSSGNWSGTDSARTSMNSDVGNSLNYDFLSSTTTSPSDSAVSLSSDNISFPKFNGGLKSLDRKHSRGKSDRPNNLSYASAGDSSSGSSTPTNSPNVSHSGFTQMDTDSWLQSVGAATDRRMPPEAGNVALARKTPKGQCEVIFTSDTMSDSSSSSENQASSSVISDNSSIDLEVYLADVNSDFIDSDSTSGHSVDHEGYWTSMHSDCGLPSRRIKKRKSSLSKEPFRVNHNQKNEPPTVQPKPKRTLLAVATPVMPKSTNQKKKPPPPPIRIHSASFDETSSTKQKYKDGSRKEAGGNQYLSFLLPSKLSDDNRSISPSSLTDTASETSTIGSDTATTPTPTPVQTPTVPAMYKLCFSENSKSLESLDSQLSSSLTTEDCKQISAGQQPNVSGAHINASNVTVKTFVTSAPVQEQASVAKFRPQHIQHSSSDLPIVSQSRPLILPSPPVSPTHEGKIKMLNARDKFFGISRSENTNNENGVADSGQESIDDSSIENEEIVSPIGVYPETYNTLKRRPKHETDGLKKPTVNQVQEASNYFVVSDDASAVTSTNTNLDEQSEGSGVLTVASQAKKGLDTLQRKRFQDYVSSVQNQAPQNYNSINNLNESGVGNGSQAMTREQREEILNMMRKAKNNKVGNSPTLPEPKSKRFDDPSRHELGKIHENVSLQEQQKQHDEESDVKTSFRSSYHVGIESDNLDPDLAIIRAAEQMEQQIRQQRQKPNVPAVHSPSQPEDPNIWLPNSQPFSRNSISYHSFYDTEMSGNSFSHIPSMTSDDSYVYDPNLKPKSSILKVRKHGEASQNEIKLNGTKHWSSSGHGQAMSPTDSVSSLNSIRSITFSDMVDVEHTPVKICLMSGKPQTPIADFKMLLQQHSGLRRGQSACSALNVKPEAQRPLNNAALLYSGSRKSSIPEEANKGQMSTPVRKIVTMKDLRTAMANPRTNSRTVDLGLPYEELQALNRQRSPKNSPLPSPNETLTKQDKGIKFDFSEIQEIASDVNSSKISDAGNIKSLPNGNVSDLAHVDRTNQSVQPGQNERLTEVTQGNYTESSHQQINNKHMSNGPTGAITVGDQTHSKASGLNLANSQSGTSQKENTINQPQQTNIVNGPLNQISKSVPHLTGSASDSILYRKDLMDAIRRRGARRDSRQEAVSELETQQLQRKLSASSMPSLTSTPNTGLVSLLDSMKTALKSMEVSSPAGEMEQEQDSGAWE